MTCRITLFLILVPALAGAQSSLPQQLPRDQEIKLAESAAPAAVSANAAVYVYGDSGYVQARAGTNGFTCLVNRDSFLDGYEVLKPTCWDAEGSATIVPQILYIGKRKAAGADAQTVRSELNTAFAEKRFTFPQKPGLAYMLNGDISSYDVATGEIKQRVFPPHLMLYASGASQKNLGVSMTEAGKDRRLPMVYAPNAQFAYIVVRVP